MISKQQMVFQGVKLYITELLGGPRYLYNCSSRRDLLEIIVGTGENSSAKAKGFVKCNRDESHLE